MVSKTSALFLADVKAPGWIFFSSFFLWAALLFTGKKKILTSVLFYPALFLPPLLLTYMHWNNFLVLDLIRHDYGWYFVWSTSLWPYLYYFFMLFFSGAGLFVIFQAHKNSDDPVRKKMTIIVFITTLISLSLGLLIEIILPKLNLYFIPDLGDVTTIFGASGLAYIMVKYRFLAITPAAAAENIISTMSDSLILLDAAGNIVRCNKATLDLLGYSEKKLQGKPFGILVGDEQRGNTILKKEPDAEDVSINEFTFKTGQGQSIPVIFSGSVLKDQDGMPVGMVCIVKDITQRKLAEKELNEYKEHLEELVEDRTIKLKEINEQLRQEIDERRMIEGILRESKEKYRSLTDNINVGIYRCAVGGDEKFLEVNPAAIKMFGCGKKEELLSTKLSQHYWNPEEWNLFNKKMIKYGFVRDEELQFKKKDSKPFFGSVSAVAVKDNGGEIIYYDGIIEDISERKQLEAKLLLSQKLEAVGRLTGGIAHEFNNMLTGIIGYTELSLLNQDAKKPVNNYLNKVLKTAGHAKDLIIQLLAFSRKAIIFPKVINLNQVIISMQKLLRKVLGENILLDFIPAKKMANVEIDPGQLEHIIMNLVANSGDAMPTGGTLTITTKNVTLDRDICDRYPYMEPGSFVLSTFKDTGSGMDKEELSHVFEPFFTTKKKSRGTGLGLSIVYGIVKQNKGFINVHSELNEGTTVDIYLPRVAGMVEEVKKTSRNFTLPSGQETILVVEDKKEVREITVGILSACGYHPISTRDAEEALNLWEKKKDQIDLLLTDIVLPGISGLQLSHKLLTLRPGLKVIYMSGYSDNVISHHGGVKKDIPFIQKPFTSNQLTKEIRKVLNS
jgi:PAS domain S-box-containing protein